MSFTPSVGRLSSGSLRTCASYFDRRAFLAASTLSILLTPPVAAAAKMSTGPPAGLSASVQAVITDVFKVYTSQDGKEQAQIVQGHYREDAHFIDPLMDTKGHDEIALAFYSLIKFFKSVEVNQKGVEVVPTSDVPADLQNYQQVAVRNQQVYHFSQEGFLGKRVFPENVDLDVTSTFTIDPQSGKIVRHQDVWNNKGFGVFSFMKRPNGAVSGALFKALGWKKDVFGDKQQDRTDL